MPFIHKLDWLASGSHKHPIIYSFSWEHLSLLLCGTQVLCQVYQLSIPCSIQYRPVSVTRIEQSRGPQESLFQCKYQWWKCPGNQPRSLMSLRTSMHCQHIYTERNHVCMCKRHTDTSTHSFSPLVLSSTQSRHQSENTCNPPINPNKFDSKSHGCCWKWPWARIRSSCQCKNNKRESDVVMTIWAIHIDDLLKTHSSTRLSIIHCRLYSPA